MKQIERQKSISWFKLAEFVERGEKERALGIYKLLALSIHDLAFTYQLEGDILLAFDDQQATTKYLQAAEHYIKQNNFNAAIGTLNHLAILTPTNLVAWEMLSELYLKHFLSKIMIHLRNLVNYKQFDCAQVCLEKVIAIHQTNQNKIELDVFISDLAKLNQNLHASALEILKK